MNILLLNYNSSFRLKSKGPACLLKITPRKTLLEKQIQILNKTFKNTTITIITGFKHKKIKNIVDHYTNIEIIENEDFNNTNCLYNVGLGLSNIKDSVLIIPGNILFKESLFQKFNDTISQLWITNEQQDIGCTINNNIIENIMWSLPNYWTNISYFTGKELDLLKIISAKDYTKTWYLFEGINHIIENGGKILPIFKTNKIQTINKISDVKL